MTELSKTTGVGVWRRPKKAATLVTLYQEADNVLSNWLHEYQDLSAGSRHVQSARWQIKRRLKELENGKDG